MLGGRPVAGSAVSYRSVRLRNGWTVLAGIMTGSWTPRDVRGRGCSTGMIDASCARAVDRGAALLLAFVAADNPSARRLAAAGSALFPTYYCVTRVGAPAPASRGRRGAEVTGDLPPDAVTAATDAPTGRASFVYPSTDEWVGQFLGRPGHVEVLRLEDDGWAIRERTDDTDRLQLLVLPGADPGATRRWLAILVQEANASGRRLFHFTTDRGVAETCRVLRFNVRPGHLTAKLVDPDVLVALGGSDRPASQRLADPDDPSYLGHWHLHGGDRV